MPRTSGMEALRAAATAPVTEPIRALRLDDGSLRLALSCEDVASLAGMTIREVWGAIERGELAATHLGRRKRITVQELLRFLGLLPDMTEQRRTA